ncbi:MAG: serine/threonine-protein phosphatase [Acidobacteria bacterium]|nr:serine/threonine-protein phosphatase [Acidobacteriota bacterium]
MFATAQVSDRGGREVNQDAVWSGSTAGCFGWALADGLGGMGGGELASAAAIHAISSTLSEDLLTMATAAQDAIKQAQKAYPQSASMRSTLVLLVSDGNRAKWMHSGDSRLYRFQRGALIEHTLDHSVPQMLVLTGKITPAEIRRHPDRNRILKSLGGASAEIEMGPGWRDLEPGDAFLLASDGFWELVTEREMEAELVRAATVQDWLQGMQVRLMERFVKIDAGQADNYSAIAVWRT